MASLGISRAAGIAGPMPSVKPAQMTEDEKAQYAYYFRSMGIDVPPELEPKPVLYWKKPELCLRH